MRTCEMLWARQMGSSAQLRFSVVSGAAVIADRVTVGSLQSFCIRITIAIAKNVLICFRPRLPSFFLGGGPCFCSCSLIRGGGGGWWLAGSLMMNAGSHDALQRLSSYHVVTVNAAKLEP
jgi:hypothetical protein